MTGRFEIIDSAGERGYADTFDGLVEHLNPGYGDQTPYAQAVTRHRLAVDAQVVVQAHLNTEAAFAEVTPAGQTLLTMGRATPPSIDQWDEPVPLVLVSTDYEPAGLIRPPGGVGSAANVLWIDPTSSETLMRTLHENGYVVVAEQVPDAMP